MTQRFRIVSWENVLDATMSSYSGNEVFNLVWGVGNLAFMVLEF